MLRLVEAIGRHGPFALAAGLATGLAFPSLSNALLPFLPVAVVALLFLAAFRIEPNELVKGLSRDSKTLALAVLIAQLVAPLAIISAAFASGLADRSLTLALVLVFSAPTIVSAPNICVMLGAEATPAMRIMATGTALTPLSILPIFWLTPQLGDVQATSEAALKLFALVAPTALIAVWLRRRFMPRPSPETIRRLDGVNAIAMAAFVIPLMSGAANALRNDPQGLAFWLAVAFAICIGTQAIAFALLRKKTSSDWATGISVAAGNRNLALFLASMPIETLAPILTFIGCYQIPMFLTPLVMRRFYARK